MKVLYRRLKTGRSTREMSDEERRDGAETSRIVTCADSDCVRRLAHRPGALPAEVSETGWQLLEGPPTRAYCPEHAREPIGPMEQEVLELLTPVGMQSPDDITNAIARLARELDERGGPILGKPADTEREGMLLLPLTGGELKGVDFVDDGGRPCSLQESSGERAGIWFGRSDVEGRMLLTPLVTARLWPHLKRFAETGELAPSPVENHDADPRDRETCRKIPDAAAERLANAAHKGMSTEDLAKSWRALVEGDVIRGGDKIRQTGGGATRTFKTSAEALRWTASHKRDPFRGAEIYR